MLTAYQLIDRRFRARAALYKVTAGLFLLTRAAAEGVRVFAVSIVVGIAIGTGDVLSIAIISALTLLYTFEGGMAAVIWTDVVQMAIYVGGTVVAIWSLGQHVPGGWATIHAVAGGGGQVPHAELRDESDDDVYVLGGGAGRDVSDDGVAWDGPADGAADAGGAEFEGVAAGAAVEWGGDLRAVCAVSADWGGAVGVLWSASGWAGGVGGAGSGNRIFPAFIVREMPRGVAGLLVAAILAAAMSNLSAALNSLSSTTVVDFYMGWRPGAEERERMVVSRASTVVWAVVLFAVAVYAVQAGGKGNVVEIGLSIASVAYGCLLGVFLLGTLTKMRYAGGGDCGDGLWVCGESGVVAGGRGVGVIPRVALDLVCADWGGGDVCGGVGGECGVDGGVE